MNLKPAINTINQAGALLVFPKNNQKEPRSLWSEFYPRTKLRWAWDDNGDGRVFKMWQLMKELSSCRQVVYSKWYQGRATFFSREVFQRMLTLAKHSGLRRSPRSPHADQILAILEMDSPLSTRQIKQLADLRGRYLEPVYARAMKELFVRLEIVAFGEVDDGAFPSLAVGATAQLYEDLWLAAEAMSEAAARRDIENLLPPGSAFRQCLDTSLRTPK